MPPVALFAICLLIAAVLVWTFWPHKPQPTSVEVQPAEDPDWQWPERVV